MISSCAQSLTTTQLYCMIALSAWPNNWLYPSSVAPCPSGRWFYLALNLMGCPLIAQQVLISPA